MNVAIASRSVCGLVLGLFVCAAACDGRNIVGQQTGHAGAGGGAGTHVTGFAGDGATGFAGINGEAGFGGTGFAGDHGLAGNGSTGFAGFNGEAGSSGTMGFAGFNGGAGFAGTGIGGVGGFHEAGRGGGGWAGSTGTGGSSCALALSRLDVGYKLARFRTERAPFAVAVSDLNADGVPDFAVVNSDARDNGTGAGGISGAGGGAGSGPGGSISVVLSLGNAPNAGYAAPRHYLDGDGPHHIAVGDLNADGKPDVAVGRSGRVRLLFNSGDGTLNPPVSLPTVEGSSIAVGDVNGDGKTDFAVGDVDVAVFTNMGSGTFIANRFNAGLGAGVLALSDLNGDGRLDVAATNGPGVGVLLNNGNGGFGPAASYGTGTLPSVLATGDLNGDGKADVAVSNSQGASVLLNLGNGSFAAAVSYAGLSDSIAIGDLNGDGRPDLAGAVLDGGCDAVAVLPNTGDGTFGAPAYIPLGTATTRNYVGSIVLEDMDGDGALDVVVATSEGVAVLTKTAP